MGFEKRSGPRKAIQILFTVYAKNNSTPYHRQNPNLFQAETVGMLIATVIDRPEQEVGAGEISQGPAAAAVEV